MEATDTLTASGGVVYHWSTGDSTVAIAVSPNATTAYAVTVTNTAGCTATDNITVTVNPLPDADAGYNASIALGDTAKIIASGGTQYHWDIGDSTAAINVSPSTATIYYVTVTDANGCSATDDVTVLVGTSVVPNAEGYWQKNDSVISTISAVNNVGINIDNPTRRLEVGGDAYIQDSLLVGKSLRIDSLAGDGYKFDSLSLKSYTLVYADETGVLATFDPYTVSPTFHVCGTPSTAWFLGGNQINSTNANANYIGTCNYRPFRIFTNGFERFRITEDGNLGIGTDDPENYKAKIDAGEDNGLWIKTTHGNSQYGYCFKMDVDRDDTKAMAVWNSGIENFLVYGSGRVFAREITVSLGTLGDFVFDKNYNLMTIRDLEKFIYKNHHLPGIPSASDVDSNGLNVGEFQNLLLQKIEELTLYVIQLQKQIDELKIENNHLKGE